MASNNLAPLAQLGAWDKELWHELFSARRHSNPGSDSVTQALAASLMGDQELAAEILRDGSIGRNDWPELP